MDMSKVTDVTINGKAVERISNTDDRTLWKKNKPVLAYACLQSIESENDTLELRFNNCRMCIYGFLSCMWWLDS